MQALSEPDDLMELTPAIRDATRVVDMTGTNIFDRAAAPVPPLASVGGAAKGAAKGAPKMYSRPGRAPVETRTGMRGAGGRFLPPQQVQTVGAEHVNRPADLGTHAQAARKTADQPRPTAQQRAPDRFGRVRSVANNPAARTGARGALGKAGLVGAGFTGFEVGRWLGGHLEQAVPWLRERSDARESLARATENRMEGQAAADEETAFWTQALADYGEQIYDWDENMLSALINGEDPMLYAPEEDVSQDGTVGGQAVGGGGDAVSEQMRGEGFPHGGDPNVLAQREQAPAASAAGGQGWSDIGQMLTSDGMPDPEKMSRFSKAISSVSKALEEPAVWEFLGHMGMAFGQGHAGSPGTILGQAAVTGAQAEMEGRAMRAALAGEDVDFSGLTSDAVRSVGQTTMQMREQSRLERETDVKERQERVQGYTALERIRQIDEQLGLSSERLDLDWFKAISDLYLQQAGGTTKPDGVDSFVHGYALNNVASSFQPIAEEAVWSRREELGLRNIAQVQQVLSASDSDAIDPMAVRRYLPPELQKEFDRQTLQMSYATQHAYRNIDQPWGQHGFQPGFPSPDDPREVPEGVLYNMWGGIWMSRGPDRNALPMDAAAKSIQAQMQGQQEEPERRGLFNRGR